MRAIEFSGEPIFIEFRPCLRAAAGRLLCGGERGEAVHAGSFLRARRIVLDRELLRSNRERDRILAHEILHFVWLRLGNPRRRDYEKLLQRELAHRIGGEAGWSAEWRKSALRSEDRRNRTLRWREYCAESFCDTGAFALLGLRRHPEMTLPAQARRHRARWFEENVFASSLKI